LSGFGKRYSSFDRFQQLHRWLGFPLAVLQKYADDQGGYLAASITYCAFFAVSPLLLVLMTPIGAAVFFFIVKPVQMMLARSRREPD
jgi:uncharacterized BrkB/YihY/UPF0761 family membrane protein